MQQHPAVPLFYTPPQGMYNQDGGGMMTHQSQWLQDNKPNHNQYQQNHQWDNNAGYHVTGGNNFGPGQVQTRVGPQQPQQQSHPPPTSTPPNPHGDINKQTVMQNQQAQMNFVQRPLAQNYAFRGMQPQNRLPTHNARAPITGNIFIPQVLASTPTPTLVQTYQPGPTAAIMYGQPRQGAPYPSQSYTILQQPPTGFYPNASYGQQVFPHVVQQQQYQQISSGGPSPQGGAPQQSMGLMRPPSIPNTTAMAPPKQEHKKRTHAIQIIDPNTNEEVVVDESSSNNNNVTPSRSNDSSARETPQPSGDVPATHSAVAADFAARVAARAMSSESYQSPEPVQDSVPSDSETHHKQSPVVPSSEKIVTTTLSTSSEEFVPRSLKQTPSEPLIEETSRTPYVPTVSAETNAPVVEILRSKEPFPALKNQNQPSGPVAQSPLRANLKKQKSSESERQQVPSVPVTVTQPPPAVADMAPVETRDTSSNKKGPKSVPKDEAVVSKERKDKPKVVSKDQSPAPSPVVSDSASSLESAAVSLVKPSTLPPAFSRDTTRSSVTPPVEEPAAKMQQQQNGETPVVEATPAAVDGNKTTARQNKSNKKSGKMRDLNRKGIEKEGSDMDAFMETNTAVEDRASTPPSPAPSAPAIKRSPTPPPQTVTETVVPQSPVDKIKEDLEEKEDKMVAARNEENAKVSAMTNAPAKLEEEVAPVIVPEKTGPPQLTLRHSYKEGHWSPLNPEGKKKYEREFLMELKMEPQSLQKPENLPDIVAVISNNMRNQNMNFAMRPQDMNSVMLPQFLQRQSLSQRGPLPPKRNSQQGMKGKNQGPKVIHVSLIDDVKLKTAENAWKPVRFASDAEKSEEEKKTEELYKTVRGILNKLTPQKFDTLMQKFMKLPIDSQERLVGVINLIFEKAVDEPSFSKAYANMCKICSKIEVKENDNKSVNFRKILITRCQHEFESNKSDQLDSEHRLKEINNCTDPEQKKELQLAYDEKERQIRMKSVGNIRFIGELFKLGMLTPAIMYRCIEHLLSTPEEESLECLCKLLTTIGKDLELGQPKTSNSQPSSSLNPYFNRMADLAQKKEGSKVSSRVRFMLQDVIDLRANRWVPRREDNNPKTIDQITKEAEKESLETSIALSQPPPRMNRQNDRQDDRKRGNRNNNQQSEEGWSTVNSSRHYNSKFQQSFDASKVQNMVKPDLDINSISFGGSSQFRFGSTPKVESKPFTSSNAYSALSREERKPPPQPTMNNRRMTPTPSIEKERQRMIQGVETTTGSDGRSSRGSSAQRERPSRENSQPRQRDNKEVSETKSQDRASDAKSEEKLERATITIFDEYLNNFTTVEDVRQDIEQLYPPEKVGLFVEKALSIALEKKEGVQKSMGELLSHLMDYKLFSSDIIVEQFGFIYEMADDLAIDIPKVWELQAQIIVPILATEKINFSHFKSACNSVLKTSAASKLLVPVFKLLASEKGAGFVRKVWDSSNVSLKDFLPSDVTVDAFIQEHSLEYLTGEAPKYENSITQASVDQVQAQMLRLMQAKAPFEEIVNCISTSVGDKVEDPMFIRALITAICEACIAGTNNNINLDQSKFKQYDKLIQRYVDNKEERELACLNAVHTLVSKLDFPQGLIVNIFNLFLDNNLISCESFLKWRQDDQEKLPNKGVSILSLSSFFSALEEGETDDENS